MLRLSSFNWISISFFLLIDATVLLVYPILSSSAIMLTLWFWEIESWVSTFSIVSLFYSYLVYDGRLISKFDFWDIESPLFWGRDGGSKGLPFEGACAFLTLAV